MVSLPNMKTLTMAARRTGMAVVAIFGIILILGTTNSLGAEVTVTLSDGKTISMKEPSDMMGLTWEGVKDSLPRVFLTVDNGSGNIEAKVSQLLATTGSIGHLYVKRYERAVGDAEDGSDLFKVEESLARIRAGEGTPIEKEAVREGEAVIFWSAMLEDNARDLEIKAPANPAPNASPAFLDEYAGMIEKGDDSAIYAEAVRWVSRYKSADFSSYLSQTTPERRKLLAGFSGEAAP